MSTWSRWRRLVIVLVMFTSAVVWLYAAQPLRANAPVTLEAYRRALDQAIALMQQANNAAPDARPPLLKQAALLLSPIHAVQLPSGQQTPVDNTALLTQLTDPQKTASSLARLTALRSALALPLAANRPGDLAALRDILGRPPFAANRSGNWLTDIVDRLREFLSRLFNNTARGIFEIRDLFVLAGVLLVVVVVTFLIRNLRRNLVSEEALPGDGPGARGLSPAEVLNEAEQWIAAGDYRRAVRQLYLATLLMLDRRGKLKFDAALTNREYLCQTSTDSRTTAALEPIVETFDRIWYGFEPLSAQELDTFRQQVERVRE